MLYSSLASLQRSCTAPFCNNIWHLVVLKLSHLENMHQLWRPPPGYSGRYSWHGGRGHGAGTGGGLLRCLLVCIVLWLRRSASTQQLWNKPIIFRINMSKFILYNFKTTEDSVTWRAGSVWSSRQSHRSNPGTAAAAGPRCSGRPAACPALTGSEWPRTRASSLPH